MSRSTNATFKVEGGLHVDGQRSGTLIIEAPKATGTVIVTFRPHHSRREYTLTIGEVCEMIASRAVKKGTVYENARVPKEAEDVLVPGKK